MTLLFACLVCVITSCTCLLFFLQINRSLSPIHHHSSFTSIQAGRKDLHATLLEYLARHLTIAASAPHAPQAVPRLGSLLLDARDPIAGKVATMARNLLDERELAALLGRAAASTDSSSQAMSVGGIAPTGLGPGLGGSSGSSSSGAISSCDSGGGGVVGGSGSSGSSSSIVTGPSTSEHTYGVLNALSPASHAVHHLGGGTLHGLGLGDGPDPRASGCDGDGLPSLLNALGVPSAAWNPHHLDSVRLKCYSSKAPPRSV
jgi:hypothetical protein